MPGTTKAKGRFMSTEVVGAQTAFTEKRRWPRYRLNVPVRVIVGNEKTVRVMDGRGTELNEGGMAVMVGAELKTGDLVAVEFTPPYDGQPVRVQAQVRNRNGYTYGVEFSRSTADDCEKVDQIRLALQGIGSLVM